MEDFFREYKPPLTKDANTCVGLALLLIGKLALLDEFFPGVKECLYLVSCEESIEVWKIMKTDNLLSLEVSSINAYYYPLKNFFYKGHLNF